jgi:hypothetical protein
MLAMDSSTFVAASGILASRYKRRASLKACSASTILGDRQNVTDTVRLAEFLGLVLEW